MWVCVCYQSVLRECLCVRVRLLSEYLQMHKFAVKLVSAPLRDPRKLKLKQLITAGPH